MSRKLLVAVYLLSLLVSPVVLGEHEETHRYTIRGYTLDAEQRPRSGVTVSIYRKGKLLRSATTDAGGYYEIRVHLHDSDIGKPLTVRAGGESATIKMSAKWGDEDTKRVHDVNFIDGQLVEENLDRSRLPSWLPAVAGAAAVILATVAAAVAFSRSKRRKARSQIPKASQPKKRKRKKKRR